MKNWFSRVFQCFNNKEIKPEPVPDPNKINYAIFDKYFNINGLKISNKNNDFYLTLEVGQRYIGIFALSKDGKQKIEIVGIDTDLFKE